VIVAGLLAEPPFHIDSVVALFVGVLVLRSALSLAWEVLSTILEGTPRDIDVGVLADGVAAAFVPVRMHHVHVWVLSPRQRLLSWRVQELAEGGLSQSALDKITALGDQMPERWRRRMVTPVHLEPRRDSRLPGAGSVMRRTYRGELHEVTIRERDVEYRGQSFRSLSTVARHITGTAWNGNAFFGRSSRSKERA